jgi:uncharacterized protein (DUF849 family)
VIAIGRHNPELTAIGPALGGNARAGLEDTPHLREGESSPGNTPLVARAVRPANDLDRQVADATRAARQLRPPAEEGPW